MCFTMVQTINNTWPHKTHSTQIHNRIGVMAYFGQTVSTLYESGSNWSSEHVSALHTHWFENNPPPPEDSSKSYAGWYQWRYAPENWNGFYFKTLDWLASYLLLCAYLYKPPRKGTREVEIECLLQTMSWWEIMSDDSSMSFVSFLHSQRRSIISIPLDSPIYRFRFSSKLASHGLIV